jgi:hypothetical protein
MELMTITIAKVIVAVTIESVGLVKINKAFVKFIKLKLVIELIAADLKQMDLQVNYCIRDIAI